MEILDITRTHFLRFFLLWSGKYLVTQVWFIFQVYFSTLGWHKRPLMFNCNKFTKILLNNLPFCNNQLLCPNAIVLTATKTMTIRNVITLKTSCKFYIWISICFVTFGCLTSCSAQTSSPLFPIKNEILGFKKDRNRSKEISFLFQGLASCFRAFIWEWTWDSDLRFFP